MTVAPSTTTGTTGAPGAPADLQERLDAYWSGRAAAYHSRQVTGERARASRAVWHEVWAGALPPAPARVLDAGTGSGFVAAVLAELGHDVLGVDSSTGMLAEAEADAQRRRAEGLPAPRYAAGDAVDLAGVDLVAADVADGAPWDAVTSRYLLWTLRDPVAALRSWSRVLRPGGVVACVDANWYPGGIDRTVEVESVHGPDAFVAAYDTDAEAALPLATAADPAAYVDAFVAAGLLDVEVTDLDEVVALDRRHGVSPGHRVLPQFLVTGRTARA